MGYSPPGGSRSQGHRGTSASGDPPARGESGTTGGRDRLALRREPTCHLETPSRSDGCRTPRAAAPRYAAPLSGQARTAAGHAPVPRELLGRGLAGDQAGGGVRFEGPEAVMSAGDDIVREVRIDAPPDVVFPFFTEPDKMIVWKAVE